MVSHQNHIVNLQCPLLSRISLQYGMNIQLPGLLIRMSRWIPNLRIRMNWNWITLCRNIPSHHSNLQPNATPADTKNAQVLDIHGYRHNQHHHEHPPVAIPRPRHNLDDYVRLQPGPLRRLLRPRSDPPLYIPKARQKRDPQRARRALLPRRPRHRILDARRTGLTHVQHGVGLPTDNPRVRAMVDRPRVDCIAVFGIRDRPHEAQHYQRQGAVACDFPAAHLGHDAGHDGRNRGELLRRHVGEACYSHHRRQLPLHWLCILLGVALLRHLRTPADCCRTAGDG
jgi:hypothetical protein